MICLRCERYAYRVSNGICDQCEDEIYCGSLAECEEEYERDNQF